MSPHPFIVRKRLPECTLLIIHKVFPDRTIHNMSDKSYTDMARDTLSSMGRRMSDAMQPGSFAAWKDLRPLQTE